VRACYEAFNCSSLFEFCREIENLFTDGTAAVELSTIHRAKGLEVDRVFIIRPDKLPLCWKGQLPWQAKQEQNLKYVAITRAKKELYWVEPTAAETAKSTRIQAAEDV
jgi:DNA helicase II / ATP-dependent DNA helicase PcrA